MSYVIEVYKFNEFIGYSTGNYDYDKDKEKYPCTVLTLLSDEIGCWDYTMVNYFYEWLKDEFIMYDFKIKEVYDFKIEVVE